MSDEYYAEDTFGGGVATSKVYTGPFLTAGFSMIIGSFAMASITKRSPNLSFRWLQRRVGAQFMTVAYFFTTNILYYHDGRRWRTRDINALLRRAYAPLVLDWERRKRAAAKKATDNVTGGLHQQ